MCSLTATAISRLLTLAWVSKALMQAQKRHSHSVVHLSTWLPKLLREKVMTVLLIGGAWAHFFTRCFAAGPHITSPKIENKCFAISWKNRSKWKNTSRQRRNRSCNNCYKEIQPSVSVVEVQLQTTFCSILFSKTLTGLICALASLSLPSNRKFLGLTTYDASTACS